MHTTIGGTRVIGTQVVRVAATGEPGRWVELELGLASLGGERESVPLVVCQVERRPLPRACETAIVSTLLASLHDAGLDPVRAGLRFLVRGVRASSDLAPGGLAAAVRIAASELLDELAPCEAWGWRRVAVPASERATDEVSV